MIRSLACILVLAFALPAAAEPIRVMSYNIRYDNPADMPPWPERRPHMIRQMAFLAPDIIGLQEALLPMVDALVSGLPGYGRYGVGRDDGKAQGESTTVLYRTDRFDLVKAETTWCSKTPNVPSKDYDANLPRTLTRLILRDKASGQLLDVRNAHFDHIGVVAREKCAEQIEATPVWPQADIVVLGDFNSGPDSAPYRVLTDDRGLKLADARTLAKVEFGPRGTFNGFDIQKSGDAIDHIFVARDTVVIRYGVLTDSFDGKVISDHFPVVADLILPTGR
jgi:endonuclease/exonuclease/phosphatase family metal-dependent hydrolase